MCSKWTGWVHPSKTLPDCKAPSKTIAYGERLQVAAVGSIIQGHAFQFAHIRRLLCSRHDALLEPARLEPEEKPTGRCQLHFLWRMESAVRCAPIFDHRDGFLAGPADSQGPNPAGQETVACRQCVHESEHARLL